MWQLQVVYAHLVTLLASWQMRGPATYCALCTTSYPIENKKTSKTLGHLDIGSGSHKSLRNVEDIHARTVTSRFIMSCCINKRGITYSIGRILSSLQGMRVTFLRLGSFSSLELLYFQSRILSKKKMNYEGKVRKMASQEVKSRKNSNRPKCCNAISIYWTILKAIKDYFCVNLSNAKQCVQPHFYQQPIPHNTFSTNIHL